MGVPNWTRPNARRVHGLDYDLGLQRTRLCRVSFIFLSVFLLFIYYHKNRLGNLLEGKRILYFFIVACKCWLYPYGGIQWYVYTVFMYAKVFKRTH